MKWKHFKMFETTKQYATSSLYDDSISFLTSPGGYSSLHLAALTDCPSRLIPSYLPGVHSDGRSMPSCSMDFLRNVWKTRQHTNKLAVEHVNLLLFAESRLMQPCISCIPSKKHGQTWVSLVYSWFSWLNCQASWAIIPLLWCKLSEVPTVVGINSPTLWQVKQSPCF